MTLLFSIFSTVLLIVEACALLEWSYPYVDEWPGICQYGGRQSPIELSKFKAEHVNLPPLDFLNYSTEKAILENDGHTVKINIIDSGKNSFPILTGAALHGEYTLDNVHFHWHSEHTIDGKRYPLEAHFVHYKMLYGSMREAINYPDGVIVLGVMFKMADCGSEELNSVVYTTWKVNMPKTKTELSSFDPYSILPGDKKSYYKYSGSLTTPECNEGVTWIVFENPVPLSEEQFYKLSRIFYTEENPVYQNYRPLQELHGRKVLYNIRR